MFETLALTVILSASGGIVEPVELPTPPPATVVQVQSDYQLPDATYYAPDGTVTVIDLSNVWWWRCDLGDGHTLEAGPEYFTPLNPEDCVAVIQ